MAATSMSRLIGFPETNELFSEVWESFYPRALVLARLSLRSLGSADEVADAEDAVQEAMIKVLQNLHRYDRRYALSTWVFTIVRNQCRDFVRTAGRSKTRRFADGEAEAIGDRAAGPEQMAIRGEFRDEIDRAVEALPPRDIEIAYLRFYEDLPYREIGRVMRMPTGSVKYRVHAIRRRIATKMEGGHGEK